ncbi:MAG: helix-turn-helix domain-containing protein, partial [Kiloniellaceae bacterium]
MVKVEATPSPRRSVPTDKAVPALSRGVRIVDAVIAAERAPTVSELSRRLALPKSTVHGLCGTLVELGLLARRGETTFVVGP